MMSYPSLAKHSARSTPMPTDAPVTRAVCPSPFRVRVMTCSPGGACVRLAATAYQARRARRSRRTIDGSLERHSVENRTTILALGRQVRCAVDHARRGLTERVIAGEPRRDRDPDHGKRHRRLNAAARRLTARVECQARGDERAEEDRKGQQTNKQTNNQREQ